MLGLEDFFNEEDPLNRSGMDEFITYCLQHLGHFAIVVHFLDQLYRNYLEDTTAFSFDNFLRAYRQKWDRNATLLAKNLRTYQSVGHGRILVHSNSSTITSLFLALSKDNDPSNTTIFQTISHPKKEGLIQGNALQQQGWKVIFIEDAAMGKMLTQSDWIMLGCDVITTTTFVNKIGSMPISAAARLLSIPIYVAGDERKLVNDRNLPKELEAKLLNEAPRDLEELALGPGKLGFNSYFEHVPLEWINGFVMDKGVFSPQELREKALNSSYSDSLMKLSKKLDQDE